MSSDGCLGYRSLVTMNSSIQYLNAGGIYDDKIVEVSADDVRRVFRPQAIIHCFYCNRGVYHHGDQSGDDGKGGYRSQDQPLLFLQ